MNLNEMKFAPLAKSAQIIVFDEDGTVLESDDVLVRVGDKNNVFKDTMLAGMDQQLNALSPGSQITFDCIHTDLFGRESHYDFIITRLEDPKASFSWIIYDFGKQYNKIFELQQERNIAEMQSKKLERDRLGIEKEKETFERLYKELQDQGVNANVLVKDNNVLVNIDFKQILYLEAYGDYIKVHTDDKIYLTHNTMKNVLEILPSTQFFKVNRSYIVRLDAIENIEQRSLLIGETVIPIGRAYKTPLLERLKQI